MAHDFYADVAPIYDRMIRWERRLQGEAPLFADLWRRFGTKRVLDAACGSGRHLLLFTRQGLEVTGSDASSAMLALARAQAETLPETERPLLIQSTWAELPEEVDETFDAVLCMGNSLPYVTEPGALEASLRGLWSRVAPGGFLLIQFKNFAGLRARGEKFLPLSALVDETTGIEYVCIREYHWHGHAVDFNVILLARPIAHAPASTEAGVWAASGPAVNGLDVSGPEASEPQAARIADPAAGWTLSNWMTPLATWTPREVAAPLEALGASVHLYGSLGFAPFDELAAEDVVLLAERV